MNTEKQANPNEVQIGGNHYKFDQGEQHWDRVHRLKMNWYAANVTKYVERYPLKNGLQDLLKAQHYLAKLIEVERLKVDKAVGTGPVSDGSDPVARGYVNQAAGEKALSSRDWGQSQVNPTNYDSNANDRKGHK